MCRKGFHADAVFAAELEVRRHVALGLHPNVVGLVDVGLFRQPPHPPRCNSWSAHIGLVFDLYEIDVRQFLKKSSFTQGGMRHVLNSVLGGCASSTAEAAFTATSSQQTSSCEGRSICAVALRKRC